MKFKHHLIRKFNESKQVPLWKWIVIIFLVIAMPLFFAFARTTKIQQVFGSQGQVFFVVTQTSTVLKTLYSRTLDFSCKS